MAFQYDESFAAAALAVFPYDDAIALESLALVDTVHFPLSFKVV